ncbi:MAG: hypothetical protein H0X25_04150, partial [Acidobacteriales bacterium]|nr:hypothetical protein [Terriglobales bacterium]
PFHDPQGYQGDDLINQQSLIYTVYSPNPYLVKNGVVLFNGAFGGLTIDTWDPTSNGYFATHDCKFDNTNTLDPECDYNRVRNLLNTNGYTEKQVQAIFYKVANEFPQCDLKHTAGFCSSQATLADAYLVEQYLGRILRYLQKGLPNSNPPVPQRYTNLQQVFFTSRIYGGYAVRPPIQTPNDQVGCQSPEPYAYETGFSIQRATRAQIDSTADIYSGALHFDPNSAQNSDAPWFDWGPYLWANSVNASSNGLNYCDHGSTAPSCLGNGGDVRYGDPLAPNYWGDHVHPTYNAQSKITPVLRNFLLGTLIGPQSYISNWVTWAKP